MRTQPCIVGSGGGDTGQSRDLMGMFQFGSQISGSCYIEPQFLFIRTKNVDSGDSSSFLVFAMIDSFGFFPLSGIRFTSLYIVDLFSVFMAMACSRRGMCLVAPAVSRSGMLLSSDRRGGCTPCSRPGSGSICVDDEYLR